MSRFIIATSLPLCLTGLAAVQGGIWGWLAVGYVTVLVFTLDRLIAHQPANPDPDAEFPAADALLIGLGLGHLALLPLAVWAIAGASALAPVERLLVAIAAGLVMGQISHPVAHELIHRGARFKRRLGRLIYTSLLFGHHASAHLHVHHVHVASAQDPSSARGGEGFYRYTARAWPGGFMAGLRAENRRQTGRSVPEHPYILYLGGAAGALLISGATLGWRGVAALVFIAGYAQIQILLSDYVQHYGLRRAVLPDGRAEPVGPQHSWNAPHVASAAMTLNAPRHSDHHVIPKRPYPALQLTPPSMPVLPYALPVMAVLALVPPLWRRIMDPHAARWRNSSGGAGPDLAG
ncbi:alkane 1-monooxygenase [uncultured Roseovarius sp.]|uniref:alkane 1-monooxygenase n=1 Tax=uncultured Roseovarius sp. TaxID=293344 RepID=UPI00260F0B69|nr:alkane 1-monooxygenase [uncultured Roseovarius sp.]